MRQINPRLTGSIGERNLSVLSRKEVAIVGVGSYGARIAKDLGGTGLGRMTLVDPDEVSEDIAFRYPVGRSWLGRPKVEAMKFNIEDTTDCEVVAVPKNIFDHTEAIDGADLVIVAGLGSEPDQIEVGRLAKFKGKSLITGGLYRRAQGGEISIVDPEGSGPCYTCVSQWMGRREMIVNQDTRHPYGVLSNQLHAEPGLGAEIGIVAGITAIAAMRHLLGLNPLDWSGADTSQFNAMVWGTYEIQVRPEPSKVESLGPLSYWLLPLAQHPSCPDCFSDNDPQKPLDDVVADWR